MNNEERQNHAYLGDAVYVESTPIHIILRTGDHRDGHCDNKIYLEQDILVSFLEWVAHIKHMDKPSVVQNLHLQKLFGILEKRCEVKHE
jgi:hypothetical protein